MRGIAAFAVWAIAGTAVIPISVTKVNEMNRFGMFILQMHATLFYTVMIPLQTRASPQLAELNYPPGARFGHVNRAIRTDRNIVNRVEHRIARFPEADRCDNIPVAIELKHACVFLIVVSAAYSDVEETFGIRVNTKYAPCGLSVFCACPLSLEVAKPVEQLKPRVLAVRDKDIRIAGHKYKPMRITELTLARSLLTPFLNPFSVR